MKSIILFFSLILFSPFSYAQDCPLLLLEDVQKEVTALDSHDEQVNHIIDLLNQPITESTKAWLVDRAIEISKTLKVTRLGDLLLLRAESCREQGKTDSALYFIETTTQLAHEDQDSALLGKSYLYLSSYYFKDSLTKSVELAKKAVDILEAHGLLGDKAQAYAHLGTLYSSTGLQEEGVKLYYKVLNLTKDLRLKGKLYINLGDFDWQTGNKVSGKKHYHKALKLFQKACDYSGLSECYKKIGNNFRVEQQYDSAMYYQNKALEIVSIAELYPSKADIFNKIALIYESQGLFQKALEFNQKALTLQNKYNIHVGKGTSYVNAGLNYIRLGQNQKGLDFIQQGIDLAKEKQELLLLSEAYRILSLIHIALKDTVEAYEPLFQYNELAGKMYSKELARSSEVSKVHFETREKIAENKLLIVENQLKEQRINQQFIIIILLVIGGLFFLTAYIIISRQKKQIQTLKDLREHDENLLNIHLQYFIGQIKEGDKVADIKENLAHHIDLVIRLKNFLYNQMKKTVPYLILLKDLSKRYEEIFNYKNCNIQVMGSESVRLRSRTIILLTPAISELIKNSLKHAVPPKDENIQVNLSFEKDKKGVHIKISDNGTNATDFEKESNGKGIQLVDEAFKQLGASWQLNYNNGLEHSIKFNN